MNLERSKKVILGLNMIKGEHHLFFFDRFLFPMTPQPRDRPNEVIAIFRIPTQPDHDGVASCFVAHLYERFWS